MDPLLIGYARVSTDERTSLPNEMRWPLSASALIVPNVDKG